MSYIDHLQFKQRRHPVKRVSPAQAVARLNTIVDEANAQIAKAVAAQRHFEAVAEELAEENAGLRTRIEQMGRRIEKLEKRLRKKAGKRRNEWLDDMEGEG